MSFGAQRCLLASRREPGRERVENEWAESACMERSNKVCAAERSTVAEDKGYVGYLVCARRREARLPASKVCVEYLERRAPCADGYVGV